MHIKPILTLIKLGILLAYWLAGSAVGAVPSVVIDGSSAGSLARHMEFLIDTEGTLDVDAARARPELDPAAQTRGVKAPQVWQPVVGDNIIGGFTRSVYWVRFTVDNLGKDNVSKDQDQPWVLEVNYAILDYIELYTPTSDQQFTKTLAGDRLPFTQRAVNYRNVVFPMLTPAQTAQTYYLRFQTESSMYIDLNFWPGTTFYESIDGQLLVFGVLYGIVFLAGIYCVINFIFMRERMHLFIAITIFSSLVFSLSLNGFAFQHLWPNSLWLQSVIVPVLMNLGYGSLLLYSREFLNLRQASSRYDTVIIVLAGFCLVLSALSLVMGYGQVIRLSTIAAIVVSISAFWTGVICLYYGNKAARFYLFGWMALMVGLVSFALKSLGVIPSTAFTVWGQEFGFAGIAIFLTLAQSDRFFQEQRKQQLEQNKAMSALLSAEKKYRSLFENAIEGIFQLDLEGKLVSANSAFATILGRAEVSALLAETHPPFALNCLAEGERERFRAILDKEHAVSDFQTSFVLPSGEVRWIAVSVQKIENKYRMASYYEGAMADVTETKKRQQAETQQHMAEASTEAKSLFLANMSHEIRTPMNAIIGFTDLALARNQDPQLSDFLRKTRVASANLLAIINDILDFSKIEAGKLEIEHVPFSLHEVLNNLKNVVAANIAAKKLAFNIQVDPDIPDQLLGDPLRIGQVLLNLTNNAVKFTAAGSVTVALELLCLNKQDMTITLSVSISDTGIGIAPDKLKTLFSSFTQADQSTTRRFGGTGLGLSISKQLVELMGGELTVESQLDQGSTFTFTLECQVQERRRRNDPHFIKPELTQSPLAEPQLSKPQLPLNVLVVDDQQDARELLEKALISLAHQVTCVSRAEQAIEELLSKQEAGAPYDVLIADWFMPDMDGIRCCQHIQDNPKIRKPRMVIVTGYDLEQAKQQSKQVRIDAFMLKPVQVQELAHVLQKVFHDRRAVAPQSQPPLPLKQALTDLVGLKVLLVEDIEMNQEIAVEILSTKGITVTLANNGQEGVESAKTGAFDLVLMDMQMPVMDGCTATEKIREFDRQIPIIAMTANAMAGDKNKCLASGMNDYVTKPINPDELFSAIARWAKR